MKKLDIVSHLPNTSISFNQEDSSSGGTLVLSGITNYGVESINVISGINPAHPFTALDFGNKDLVIANDRHTISLGRSITPTTISILQGAQNQALKMNFGTVYLADDDNRIADVFTLSYKTGNLNLNVRPRVNGTAVSLVGEDVYIHITGNQTSIVNGTKYLADTRSASFAFNLPASPSTGNYLEFVDPFYTWSGNNFILSGNGNNIEGDNSPFTGDVAGLSMKSVFVGGIYGWRIV